MDLEQPVISKTNRGRLSFLYAIPIGVLGGLIGLGGAEFRLPVLAGPLNYTARQAVPLNLAVSLVTIITALLIRSGTLSLGPLVTMGPEILALILGAVGGAFWGTTFVKQVSNEQLERVILVFLVGVGLALMVEAFLPQETLAGFLPTGSTWRVAGGVGFGLAIGLLSSMLGVAGGELIIPILVFAYGVEIKAAGSISLAISLPTVVVGVIRYAGQGAFSQRHLRECVGPMSIGSVIGAALGGILVGIIPGVALKFLLGVVLNVSAIRIFYHRR